MQKLVLPALFKSKWQNTEVLTIEINNILHFLRVRQVPH